MVVQSDNTPADEVWRMWPQRLYLTKALEIGESHDEAYWARFRVLEDAPQVGGHADRGRAQAVERSQAFGCLHGTAGRIL